MENTNANNTNDNGASPEAKPKSNYTSIIIIAAILIFPILFLVFKSVNNNSPVAAPEAQPDISQQIVALEQQAAAAPTLPNLTSLSVAYLNNNMAGKSIGVINQALALDSNNFVCYNNLGLAYTIIGNYQKGIESCTRALEIDSTSQLAKNNLNWAKTELKRVNGEIEKMNTEPETKRDASYFVRKGLLYANNLNDIEKSCEVYNEGLAKFKDNVDLLNNLGVNYINLQRYDESVTILEKAAASGIQLYINNLNWAKSEQKAAADRNGPTGSRTAKK